MNSPKTLLPVVRSYLPLLAGIAVAVVNLAITHTSQGAQEVHKMETLVVTANRLPAPEVVKMETIVVTARRETPRLTVAYAE